MAILNVPSQYGSISEALDNAASGDTIKIAATYTTAESIELYTNNLTFDAPAQVANVKIYAQTGVKVTLTGDAPIKVYGSYSNDTITGNAGANTLYDSEYGDTDNDTIDGGGGADTIYVYGGTDTIKGGAGNDTFNLSTDFGSSAGGTVDGGTETDTVKVSGELGSYTFTNVEVLDTKSITATAGQFAPFATITDSTSANSAIRIGLVGNGGTVDFSGKVAGQHSIDLNAYDVTAGVTVTGSVNGDTLRGSEFNDTLDGGAGADTIYASSGIDTLRGGAGNDTFVLNYDNNGTTIDGGADVDTVQLSSDLSAYTIQNVEVLDGNNFYGTIAQLAPFTTITDSEWATSRIEIDLIGIGGTLDLSKKIAGQHSVHVDASDLTSGVVLTGSANADSLEDSRYDDTIDGGGGADTITSGGGTDTLKGGAGNDTITFYSFGDSLQGGSVDGGADLDTVKAGNLGTRTFTNVEVLESDDITGSIAQLSSFTTITDSNSPSSRIEIYLTSAGGTLDLSKKVTGLHSVDVDALDLTSAVALTGTTNADVLEDSVYNDTIDGGGGADTIASRSGNDTLKGGAGNDTFELYSYASDVPAGGTVDGGADLDTVTGGRLGTRTFSNVEVLDSGSITGSVAQLLSFATITDSNSPSSRIEITLTGAGGTLDLSKKTTGLQSVRLGASDVTSAVTVTGTVNADVFEDSAYNDTIDGGGGADTIASRSGTDTLKGGAGNDTFNLYGFEGDVPAGGTVDGGADLDTVTGGRLGTRTFSNVEVLDSGSVTGSAAQLSSFATITDSTALDSQLRIALNGAGGAIDFSTRVTGKRSVDVDASAATAGVTVTGTANADQLSGSIYKDTLDGGAGADIITGDDEGDTLKGGAGNDTFRVFGFASNASAGGTVDGGADTDKVRAYDLGGYTFTNVEVLDTSSVTATASQLSSFATITSTYDPTFPAFFDADGIEVSLAGAGGTVNFGARVTAGLSVAFDALKSTAGVNITGTASADTFVGTKYADTFDGGAGADAFRSRGGKDTLKGGTGNDTFMISGSSGTVDGGADTDTVVSSNLGKYTFSNIEVLDTSLVKATAAQLSSFATITDGESDSSDIQVFLMGDGGTLDFSKRVGDGNALDFDAAKSTDGVVVTGSVNGDTIWGSHFDDILDGFGGADVLAGGLGDDVYVTDGTDKLVEAANGGIDTVRSSVTLTLGRNLESLILTGTGAIDGTGNALANGLVGNDAANVLTGGLGADVLLGAGGKDTFVLSGGLGASNVDHITDFVAKDDTINLTKSGMFAKLTAGKALGSGQFKDITSSSTKIDGDDYIQYNHNTGALFYDTDGNGKGAKVLFAVLDTHPIIGAGDFFVV